MRRFVCFSLLILTIILLILCSSATFAGGGPKNVIVVVNDNSSVSQAIGAYYRQKRGIPDYNVCHLRCSTAETVSRAECETNVVAPIRTFLANYPVPGRIDYIVMTKGTPLRAEYDANYFLGAVSVASILTCVGESSITYPPRNPWDPNTCPPLVNPYGPTASPAAPQQYFSHQLSFGGRHFYAVTRLDAYSVTDIYRMIDDAVSAQATQGLFLLDGADIPSYAYVNDRLRQANNALFSAGYQTYYSSAGFDAQIHEFVGGQQGVMGYFSWGSNEGSSFTQAKYTSNHFLPGSIADTFVSSSGRTFTYPPNSGQSLMADLIPQGLSGCNGFVSEPNVNLVTYPNVLFDRYLKGYNLAESFLAATPELYWKAVTVGDPLMAPYATPPLVEFTNPLAGSVLQGTVLVSADASDSSGVAKVEFCINDEPIAVCTSAPYEFEWDTSGCTDGSYTLEAIAYENSPVYTQSLAKLDVIVANGPQSIARTADLASVPDGTPVELTSKVVIAGADVFKDCIYVCESDRTAGTKVVGVGSAHTGDLVDVIGEKHTTDGQCVITPATVTIRGSAPVPAPLGFVNRDIGARGVSDYSGLPVGLSSTGLLIRTWGQVQQLSDDAFYIADRSIRLPSGGTGRLKVSIANITELTYLPALGSYVEVTGCSTLERNGADLRPVLRVRSPYDIEYNLALNDAISPWGIISEQWNLLSIPGIPVNPAAASVFPGYHLDGSLQCWDAVSQTMYTYRESQPELFPPLCMGTGFWFQASAPYAIQVRVVKDEPDTDIWLSLPAAGRFMLGHPFTAPRRLNACRVSDGVQILTVADAVASGWLDSSMYYWESSTGALTSVDLAYDDSAELRPWNGYWIKSFRPNLALIVPYALD